jgi:DNA-binding transcriptional LysR family regulator
MEFMQLEMFVAVVEEGTIRAASARVFRTQPAVSMAIRKLEGEIGIPLFVRRNHTRALTPAGEKLYGYARNLLDLRRETVAALAGAS